MNKNNHRKSQGEIFGVMIFFVLIVIGFFLYSQYRIAYPDEEVDAVLQAEYRLLTDSTIQQVLSSPVACFEDSTYVVQDLLLECVRNTGLFASEYELFCNDLDGDLVDDRIETCGAFLQSINLSLLQLFNGSDALIGQIPYEFKVLPQEDLKYNHLNKTFTNVEAFGFSNDIFDQNSYRREGYDRISSDFTSIPTSQGPVELELVFYHSTR